jgi:monoamine oxidase
VVSSENGGLDDLTVASQGVAQPAATQPLDGIVIGAGLAGLKAAADLKARGYQVVVLEGRNRIGGRVFTSNLGTGSTRVEVGAQWLHGNNPNVVYNTATQDLGATVIRTGTASTLRYSKNSSYVPLTLETSFDTT